MSSPGELWRRLWFLLRRNQLDRDLQEEMRQHLDMKASEKMAEGVPAVQAGQAARREIGNITLLHERSREVWGFPRLESWFQDVRYGLRNLRKAPGFTLVAVLTLALGIGATTAIFSVVYAVILKPLPYQEAGRIYNIWTVLDAFPDFQLGSSKLDIDDVRANTSAFERIAVYQQRSMNLIGGGEPEQLAAIAVDSDFLPLLGAYPVLGRGIELEDEQPANSQVVLLNHALWERRFGSDPNITGKVITLNQRPYTVIGVMPAGFDFLSKQLFVPLSLLPPEMRNRDNHSLFVMARLRHGVRPENAQSQLDTLAARLARENPGADKGLKLRMVSLQEWLTFSLKAGLLLLLGAVGFLLLIACVNVSNLVLVRGVQRTHEIAMRAALGATRSRIARQLILESLLLAFMGGCVAILIAIGGIHILRFAGPQSVPPVDQLESGLVLGLFSFALASAAGVICGLAPAWQSSRLDLNSVLKDRWGKSGSAEPGNRFSLRNVLVVAEFSLALILLAGSVLMVQSLARLLRIDTGMRTDHLLTLELNLPQSRYSNDAKQIAFTQQLLDALKARPEFSGTVISDSPMLNGTQNMAEVMSPIDHESQKSKSIEFRGVSPGFFETMGIALLSGRTFNDHDVKGALQVAVINQTMVRHYWPGENPLGKVVKLGPDPEDAFQITGVVADIRDTHILSVPTPELFVALAQRPSLALYVTVKTPAEPTSVIPVVRNTIWSIDKDEPITHIETLNQVVATSISDDRFHAILLGGFAMLGILLTVIGIYGVIAYSVTRRTQEIGIRLALGATRRSVLQLVLAHAGRLAIVGAVIGVGGSLLLSRFMRGQLYEIKPTDPTTLIAATLVMIAVALAASYVPARRATRVDPMAALRNE